MTIFDSLLLVLTAIALGIAWAAGVVTLIAIGGVALDFIRTRVRGRRRVA